MSKKGPEKRVKKGSKKGKKGVILGCKKGGILGIFWIVVIFMWKWAWVYGNSDEKVDENGVFEI